MISSYQAAWLHMEKARNKAKGRPMKGVGWRLFQDGDDYVVNYEDVQVGRFLPDNTFVFSLTCDKAYAVAHCLSGTMHRNLPFHWHRFDKAQYRVDHQMGMIEQAWKHFMQPTNAPEIYDGLAFNMFNGKCLNRKPDFTRQVDPERRKVWLTASGTWKRKLKVMARLGVFDKLIEEEKRNPTPWSERPKWSMDEWVDILYKAVKDNDHNTDLLRMLVAGHMSTWGVTPTSMGMYFGIEKTMNGQSVALRKRFGVFGDT
jgi:hypothetical protein